MSHIPDGFRKSTKKEIFTDEDLETLIDLLSMVQGYIEDDVNLNQTSKASKMKAAMELSRKCDSTLDDRLMEGAARLH